VVADATTGLGGLDILVIGASIQSRTPFLGVTGDEIQRQFQINFHATARKVQLSLLPRGNAYGHLNQTITCLRRCSRRHIGRHALSHT
jgi:NAD(P)-dependent dehydrogenase (short-subunit alcohol dehydrogenase family)